MGKVDASQVSWYLIVMGAVVLRIEEARDGWKSMKRNTISLGIPPTTIAILAYFRRKIGQSHMIMRSIQSLAALAKHVWVRS